MRTISILPLVPMLLIGSFIAATYGSVNAAPGETGLAALTLLRDGFIGNPYISPTGPTAHTAPGTVAILAVFYNVFGGNTQSARIALSLLALLQYVAASMLIVQRVDASLSGRMRLFLMLVAALVLPLFLAQATVSYRQWDQPTTAFLLALLTQIWLFDHRCITWSRRALCLGLLGGIGSLFSPVLPIIALIAAAHLSWQQANWRVMVVAGLCVVGLMMPWLVRNELMLGSPVLTRSNFGLELAIGNNDGADGLYDLRTVSQLHPHENHAAALRVAAIGEVAYMREMNDIARAWIVDHPIRFVQLCLRRATLLIFPRWIYHDTIYRQFWTPVAWTVGLSGLAALFVLLILRQRVFPWLVCAYLPLLPAILTHADVRYSFPIFFVKLGLIVAAIASIVNFRALKCQEPILKV